MSSKLFATGAAIAASLVLAACADSPQPAGPEDPPEAAVGRGQDPLPGWFAKASLQVLALPGTVFADHDEAGGRLVFGVENEAAIKGVQTALSRLGIPTSVTTVKVVPPIHPMATLRDKFRPTRGGIQIHWGNYLCTLGFNVDHAGGRSFITNSHCSGRQGGEQGTRYYQPLSSTDPTVIATEVDDPDYLRGGPGCPKGKKCRRSDAARALYSASVGSSRGVIAKTSGPNNGSLTVTGAFTIGSQATTTNFPIGTDVNKVGRTTGWTQGDVEATCVHTNVSGSNVTQLCQTWVSRSGAVLVAGGDSGSPVFIGTGTSVQLVGILWGGSGDGETFVFSPLANIVAELGPFTATN